MPESDNTESDNRVSSLATLLKAGGDPLRLEILRILQRNSYGVLELCQILDLRQPALSYQLKVLAGAGLVVTRREGTSVFYRRAPATGVYKSLLNELFALADQLSLRQQLHDRIVSVQSARADAAHDFFQRHAHQFQDYQDLIASHKDYGEAITTFLGDIVPASAKHALELGPGEGQLLPVLCKRFDTVTAVELSAEMLEKSKAFADQLALANISFFHGDTQAAIAENLAADCITINMVLHHTPSPSSVFTDLGQLLNPGGVLLVTDLCRHDQNWAKESCGDLWLGFEPEDITEWAVDAGLNEGQSQYLALLNGFRVQLRHFYKDVGCSMLDV